MGFSGAPLDPKYKSIFILILNPNDIYISGQGDVSLVSLAYLVYLMPLMIVPYVYFTWCDFPLTPLVLVPPIFFWDSLQWLNNTSPKTWLNPMNNPMA